MPFEHFEQIAGHICLAASIAAITVVHFLTNRCRAFRVSMKGVGWFRSRATTSVIVALPLFCGLVQGARSRTELSEWLALIWFSCCYIVSLVPVHKNINGERPRLLVAGFFRDR